MSEYSMTTEAQARATEKYRKKTYDTISVKVRKDSNNKQKYQDYADKLDITLSELILKSLDYVIDHNIRP